MGGGGGAAAWPALGSKQAAGRSRRASPGGSSRTQVPGPGESVSMQEFCSEESDGRYLSGKSSSNMASFRQQAGSKKILRFLMSETSSS